MQGWPGRPVHCESTNGWRRCTVHVPGMLLMFSSDLNETRLMYMLTDAMGHEHRHRKLPSVVIFAAHNPQLCMDAQSVLGNPSSFLNATGRMAGKLTFQSVLIPFEFSSEHTPSLRHTGGRLRRRRHAFREGRERGESSSRSDGSHASRALRMDVTHRPPRPQLDLQTTKYSM